MTGSTFKSMTTKRRDLPSRSMIMCGGGAGVESGLSLSGREHGGAFRGATHVQPQSDGGGIPDHPGEFVYARDPDGIPIEFLFLPE
jgi:hypothetical protein